MTVQSTETLERALARVPVPIREAVRQELAYIEPSAITLQHIAEAVDRVLDRSGRKGSMHAIDFGREDVYAQLADFFEDVATRAANWQAVHINILELGAALAQLGEEAKDDGTKLALMAISVLVKSLFHKIMAMRNAPVDHAVFCWRYVEELRQIDREYQARHASPQPGVAQSS